MGSHQPRLERVPCLERAIRKWLMTKHLSGTASRAIMFSDKMEKNL